MKSAARRFRVTDLRQFNEMLNLSMFSPVPDPLIFIDSFRSGVIALAYDGE